MGLPYIDTAAVKARLETQLLVVLPSKTVKVYRAGEVDMKRTFGTVFPAVYILKQNFDSTNSGGSSRLLRQTFDTYLEIAIVAQRYENGVTESETARREISNAVFDCLHGYILPGTDLALDLASYTDGDPADTVNYGVQRYHTRSLYQKAVSP